MPVKGGPAVKLLNSLNSRVAAFVAAEVVIATMTVVAAGTAGGMMMNSGKMAYIKTNLVSNGKGVSAVFHDQNLVNPWGLAYLPGNPLWVSDNLTGKSTLYRPNGRKVALTVTIPAPTGVNSPSHPDGIIANSGGISQLSGYDFILDTEDGTICAWATSNNSTAILVVDNSGKGAVYKGLASGVKNGNTLLYATNFAAGTVGVYDGSFAAMNLDANAFVDNQIPAGYAPFGIASLGGNLYVSYAKQDPTKKVAVPSPGNGYIDVFDTAGVLQTRLIAQGALNAPWGMAIAPAKFGPLSNTLLVGNFGDGTINAFDPNNGTFVGTMTNTKNQPMIIPGLWALVFGDSTTGSPRTLFFTAGPKDQTAGLLGKITFGNVPMMGGGGGY
jgi:uncharacterized protein (TIGR03118 family)